MNLPGFPHVELFSAGNNAVNSLLVALDPTGTWDRVGTQLIGRVTGPMKFRLVLQPCMAAFFAIRSGLADAKTGKSPYFWTMVSDPKERAQLIRDGWKSVGKVFILAIVLDVIYQIIELHFVYVGEAIIVAFILAILPYLILRGIVTRIARRRIASVPVNKSV
jgi:hypothetical protein